MDFSKGKPGSHMEVDGEGHDFPDAKVSRDDFEVKVRRVANLPPTTRG